MPVRSCLAARKGLTKRSCWPVSKRKAPQSACWPPACSAPPQKRRSPRACQMLFIEHNLDFAKPENYYLHPKYATTRSDWESRTMMEISFDSKFHSVLSKLEPQEQSQVNTAIAKYQRSPEHPSLNLEQLNGRAGQKRLWTIRASVELRILLARQGAVTVFLQAGHHDDIYQPADRKTFVVPLDGRPGLIPVLSEAIEIDDVPRVTTAPIAQEPVLDGPSIVEHWSAGELARVGFRAVTRAMHTRNVRQCFSPRTSRVCPQCFGTSTPDCRIASRAASSSSTWTGWRTSYAGKQAHRRARTATSAERRSTKHSMRRFGQGCHCTA